MTSIDKFIGTEFRSRYVNPTWIEGMKKEGYAGAGEMRSFVEYLWGWDATVSETVDAGMWQETFAVYVQDKHDLGMKEFFESTSPFAYQDMTARMVETIRKGYWTPDATTEASLISEYVYSVARHGASGAEHTTGNARLSKFVLDRGRAAGVPVPALDAFQRAMERAMGGSVAQAARASETFARLNESRVAAALAAAPTPAAAARAPQQGPVASARVPEPSELQGYLMEQSRRQQSAAPPARVDLGLDQPATTVAAMMVLLALLLAWRQRHRAGAA
jgi:cobaltochelatase CobN